jgi:hypothetical protein
MNHLQEKLKLLYAEYGEMMYNEVKNNVCTNSENEIKIAAIEQLIEETKKAIENKF